MLRIETAKVFEPLLQPARPERGEARRPKPTVPFAESESTTPRRNRDPSWYRTSRKCADRG